MRAKRRMALRQFQALYWRKDMSPDEIKKLTEQVNVERSVGLARRAELDNNIQQLKAERRKVNEQIANADAMLKFARLAEAAAIRDIETKPVQNAIAEAALADIQATLDLAAPNHELPQPTMDGPTF